jgi:hypothetical protein
MVPRTQPVVAPTSVLRPDWETLARLASRWSKSPYLDTCPAPSSIRRFCSATDKPKSAWFWCPNQETVAVILRIKSPTKSPTVVVGFVIQTETRATGFEAKPEKTIPMVLRSNHWQTVDLGFEAQPRNMWFSSPCARCRPYISPPDFSIVRPPSTRPVRPSSVLCTRSSTPAMILITARHATPTTCTPWDKPTRFSKQNKDKGKTTKMSRIWIQISACQWLITYQTKVLITWFLRFWDPNQETTAMVLMSNHWQTVATGFEAKPGETIAVVLRPNHRQTVAIGFEVKLGETVELGFEAKSRNPHISSPCAWCRSHTTSLELSRSSGHWVPDLCLTIPDLLHQVSYSYLDLCHCLLCHTCHLHTTRQVNIFLRTKQIVG